jgi:hypothetical protein
MADILVWPSMLLVPEECRPNIVPFTRSGGKSLGGIEPVVRTDLGFWNIELANVAIYSIDQARTWNAIRQALCGRAGLIAVPVWSFDVAPYPSGQREPPSLVPHEDDTRLDDESLYQQGSISIVTSGSAPIGSTSIKLRIINAAADLSGVRFSYNHALYETGRVLEIVGDVWTVSIWPAIRELIPSGSDLEFDMPTCLCHPQDDRGMDGGLTPIEFEQRTVGFIEATDYWNDLALGLV